MKIKTLVDTLFQAERLGNDIRFIKEDNVETTISYHDFRRKAQGCLTQLREAGVKPGDEVIIQVPDNESFLYCFWGCILGKAVAVPVPIATSESEYLRVHKIWKILKKPKIISYDAYMDNMKGYLQGQGEEQLWETVSSNYINYKDTNGEAKPSEPETVNEEDLAYIQFSSGSTADPKGVKLLHGQVVCNMEGIVEAGEISQEEKVISWMPLTHDMGLVGFHLSAMFHAIHHCIVPSAYFISNPLGYLRLITEGRYNITGFPNFGYGLIMKEFLSKKPTDIDLSSLRLIFNGAEPISVDMTEKFCAVTRLKKSVIYPVYGMAEAVLAIAFPKPGRDFRYICVNRDKLVYEEPVEVCPEDGFHAMKIMSEGQAVKHCKLRISNREGNELPDGYVGQIMLKGKNILSSYYQSTSSMDGIFDEDGWYKTGDLGFIYENEVYVVGRIKDIIFVNGQNYYADAIEKRIESVFPDLYGKVVACGINNMDQNTDTIVIFVVSELEQEAFIQRAKMIQKELANYFGIVVEKIIPVSQKFTTMSGKLQRFRYAKLYNEGEYEPVSCLMQDELAVATEDATPVNLPKNQIEKELSKMCCELLELDSIDVQQNLSEFGMNSIKIMQMYTKISEKYQVKMALADVFSHPNIEALAEKIEQLRNCSTAGVVLAGNVVSQAGGSEVIKKTVSLDGEITKLIQETEQQNSDKLNIIICCSLAATLSRMVVDQNFTFYYADKEDDIYALAMDEDKLKDFNVLYDFTLQNLLENKVAEDAEMSFNNGKSLLILYSDSSENIAKKEEIFDFILCIDRTREKAEICCFYKPDKIDENTCQNLISMYANVFSNVIENI